MKKAPAFFGLITNRNFLSLLVVVLVVIISVQTYLLGPREWQGITYTHYNNYKIFSSSFWHLVEQQDLYAAYPDDHYDLFKYSPAFALLMAPFAVLPDWLGLLLWNLLNAFVLLVAILKLPGIDPKKAGWIVLLVLLELITSLRNNQSNALMAGMIILTFVNLEKGRPGIAAFLIAVSAYIKLFSLVALPLALLYRSRYRFGVYWIAWVIILGMLPLVAVPFEQMASLYSGWGCLLAGDGEVYYGLSVMGVLHSWFGIEINKLYVMLAGAIIFLVPFTFINKHTDEVFRLKLLASALIWMVIFNHMAESPTYVIAMTGAGIWFFTSQRNRLDIVLLVSAILFTSVSMTDLVPNSFKDSFIKPYVLKAVPCILIWVRLEVDLFLDFRKKHRTV